MPKKTSSPGHIYAEPLPVNDISDCFFYHTIDLPGFGTIDGHWDLRDNIDQYLGNYDFKGKRVLEIGTADGMLCFEMEKRGAQVVAVDLSSDFDWEFVPYSRTDYKNEIQLRKDKVNRLNNAFWLGHKLFNSTAKMVYSPVYHVPLEIGKVDVVTFGAVLLHLHNPFGALQHVLQLATDAVIVTDLFEIKNKDIPSMIFLPNFQTALPAAMWWYLSTAVIQKMAGVLGFTQSTVTIHKQKHFGKEKELFTVVARRT